LLQILEVRDCAALFRMNAIPVQRSATRESREHLAMREQERARRAAESQIVALRSPQPNDAGV